MPRGGHNAKPLKLKVLQGTARPDRIREGEPKPRPIAPRMPRGLDPFARRAWRRLAPTLERLGLLGEADGEMFTALVRAWARLEGAERRLQQIVSAAATGALTDEQAGRIRRAEISVEKTEHAFRLLAAEFGLTPAARSRLNISTPATEEDDFEAFLAQVQAPGHRAGR